MNLIGGGRLIELDTLTSLRALRDRAPEVYIVSSLPMSDAALVLSRAPQSLQVVEMSDSASSLCTSAGSSSTAIRSSKAFCIPVRTKILLVGALFISPKLHGSIAHYGELWHRFGESLSLTPQRGIGPDSAVADLCTFRLHCPLRIDKTRTCSVQMQTDYVKRCKVK